MHLLHLCDGKNERRTDRHISHITVDNELCGLTKDKKVTEKWQMARREIRSMNKVLQMYFVSLTERKTTWMREPESILVRAHVKAKRRNGKRKEKGEEDRRLRLAPLHMLFFRRFLLFFRVFRK